MQFIDTGLSSAPDIGALACQIEDECTAPEPRREAVVMLRNGRYAQRFDALPLGTTQREAGRRLLMQGPHIVTGGVGRIGLVLGTHLSSLGAHTVLTTRGTAMPDGPRGADKIEILQLDLSSVASIEALLSGVIRKHGRLGGIFHAAGRAELADLRDTTAAFLEAEFEPKVLGSINLKKAIRRVWADQGAAPSFVLTFSSLAAVLGGLGMAAYASANRVMDALAAGFDLSGGEAGLAVPWISVRWDDWDFDYGKQQTGAYAQTRAGLSIAPEEGLAAIEAILGEPSLRDVLVSATPLEPRLERWVDRVPADAPTQTEVLQPDVQNEIPGLSRTETWVREAYAKVLGPADPGTRQQFLRSRWRQSARRPDRS